MSTDPGYGAPMPQGGYGAQAQLAQAMSYGGLGAGQLQQPMVGGYGGVMPDPYAFAGQTQGLLGGQAQFMPQAGYPDVITGIPQYGEYAIPQYGMQSQRMYDAPTRRFGYGYGAPLIGPPIIGRNFTWIFPCIGINCCIISCQGPPMVGPPIYGSPYASPYGLPYY